MPDSALFAVDWGTSSFRAYRLDADGAVIEQRQAPLGILKVANGDFAGTLQGEIGGWLAQSEAPVLMSGMIGSRQGWSEAPYAPCPAGLADLARHLHPVDVTPGRRGWIVPGLVHRGASGPPDVMRGEETQIMGVLGAIGAGRHLICLPGTHSKWVDLVDGRVAGFTTHMTGEVFGMLRQHSILGRLMDGDAVDLDGFDRGLDRARDGGGVLHHLFGVRTHGLFGEIAASALPGYLSGLLIGHELANAGDGKSEVLILGTAELARLYQHALARFGRPSRLLDPDAAHRGLFALLPHLPKD